MSPPVVGDCCMGQDREWTGSAAPSGTDDFKEQTFARVDQLFEDHEAIDEQYEAILKLKKSGPEDARVLWRLARACQQQGSALDDKDPRKKEKLLEGRAYAQRACELAPNDFEAIKWAAGLTGNATDFLSTKERIEQGKVFSDYLDRALAIHPNDVTVLHMRGRYRYSVSQLSWIERKLASTFFSEPPKATIAEAITDFEAAAKEMPNWIENLMWLGKSHLANKDKASARKVLEHCVATAPKTDVGRVAIREAKELLAKC